MGMMNAKKLKEDGWKPGIRLKPKVDTGPGLTKQEFREEADLNVMVKRYGVLSLAQGLTVDAKAALVDVSNIGDFADVLRKVDAANEAFMQLSAEVRARFKNRPEHLVEFLQDSRNLDEAVSLGLVVKREVAPAPQKPEGPRPVEK